jgi:hypothetical protein
MKFKGVPLTLVAEELLRNELQRADVAGELSSNVVRPAAMLAACRNRKFLHATSITALEKPISELFPCSLQRSSAATSVGKG